MNKFIYFAVPVVVSVLFIFIMVSGSIIKNFAEEEFMAQIDIIKQNVESNKWEEADENVEKLKDSWHKISKKIQFSAERDEMNQLEATMARLEGAVYANDRSSALIGLFEVKLHWKNIGR